MSFHECAADRANRVRGRTVRRDGVKIRLPPTPFHIQRSFPPSLPASQSEVNLKEVTEFVYLGLCLDPTISMAAAAREIKSKAGKAHALVSAVSYSLRYDTRQWTTTTADSAIGTTPARLLTLWKSTVLPHYLLYLRYLPTRELVDNLQVAMTKSLESTLHVYGKTVILI